MNAPLPTRPHPHLRLVSTSTSTSTATATSTSTSTSTPTSTATSTATLDPDRALAERLHRRERAALSDVYRLHITAVRDAARPIVGKSSADDVAQEVFLIVSQRPTYVPLDGLADYLVRLARSVARERAGIRAHDLRVDDLDALARRGIPRSKRKRGAE